MDYEKKYKEALEWARKVMQGKVGFVLDEVLEKFPELKESEDERIKKDIISYIQLANQFIPQFQKDKWIAWLEKQGEQEQLYIRFGEIPSDEKSKIYQGEIEVGTENGVSVYPAFKTAEGDIILGLSLPITKTTLHTQQHLIEYDNRLCYLVKGDYIGKDTDGQPLINNVSIIKKIDNYRIKEEKQGEQKPQGKTALEAINEEKVDNQFCIKPVDKTVEEYNITGIGSKHAQGKLSEMIKNLKPVNEVLEQKPAWSEEDEKMFNKIAVHLSATCNGFPEDEKWANEFLNWFKTLKERVQFQSKQEWTKEDKDRYISCLQRLNTGNPEQPETINSKWFKEHVYPQKQWNPTEEQMKALHELNLIGSISYVGQGQILIELYNDLKKLKG